MIEFEKMRRRRQQLSDEETLSLLCHATAGVLSVVDEQGFPYGVPLSYVYDDHKLYFHSALTGHKMSAIRHSDKATFSVICQDEVHPETYTTHFRSVICFGRVRTVNDEEGKLRALRLLGERYNPGDERALEAEVRKGVSHVAVIEMTLEHVTGKEAIELVGKRK